MSVGVEPSRTRVGMLEGDSLLANGSSTIFNDIVMTDSPALLKTTFDPHIPMDAVADFSKSSVVSEDVDMEDLSVSAPDPAPREDMDLQIKRLQAELFREESKLILLKKMYLLQNPPPKSEKKEDLIPERKGQGAGKSPASGHSTNQNGTKAISKTGSDVRNDKLLSRDIKMQSALKGGPANNSQRSSVITQPGTLGVAELTRSLAQKSYKNAPNQQSPLPGSRNSVQNNSASKQPQYNPAEQLEQQLSSERLALKRQMEKTVLQVQPPKPPLPDINFVPATICPDFIALLGMELSANYAIHSKNLIDQSPYLEPFLCAKCGEDVCPIWKIDKESGIVVCEPCFVSARSSAARASHIENLRRAFATVLEKGKELDRQHTSALAEAKASRPTSKSVAPSNSVFPTSNSNSRQNSRNHQIENMPSYRGSERSSNKSPAGGYSSRSALPPAPSSRKPALTSPFAQLSAPLPFAPSSSIQKHSQTFGNPMQEIQHSQDAQRQYLLDLISRAPKPAQQQNWRK